MGDTNSPFLQPGSSTVTLFSIDPKTPTNIKRIGNPISSEGEFPMSLAFNSDGNRLCVLNGGTVNGVMCVSFYFYSRPWLFKI